VRPSEHRDGVELHAAEPPYDSGDAGAAVGRAKEPLGPQLQATGLVGREGNRLQRTAAATASATGAS